MRIYLPPDANCLLSVADHCLRSRNYVNLIIAGKQPEWQWLDIESAVRHCTAGAGIWQWASNDAGDPDVVMACAGDVPTLETLAAVTLLRDVCPGHPHPRRQRGRSDGACSRRSEHPHGLEDQDFDELFTRDKPVIFAFHGYPAMIHKLTYRRHNHDNIHVRGYKEEGTTTTPFDMVVLNNLDRYQLALGRHPAHPAARRSGGEGDRPLLDHDGASQALHQRAWRRHAGGPRLALDRVKEHVTLARRFAGPPDGACHRLTEDPPSWRAALEFGLACGPRSDWHRKVAYGANSAKMAATTALLGTADPSPSRASLHGLDGVNFFLAGLLAGFGPYVAAYLADQKWTQENIGFVLTASGLAGLLSQLPGGELLDTICSKRAVVALAAAVTSISALILAFWASFPPVFAGLVLQGSTGGFLGPAVAAISLGLVGHSALAERLGRNQRFASTGALVVTGLIGLIGYLLSFQAIFLTVAALALPLFAARSESVQPTSTSLARAGRRNTMSPTNHAEPIARDYGKIQRYSLLPVACSSFSSLTHPCCRWPEKLSLTENQAAGPSSSRR